MILRCGGRNKKLTSSRKKSQKENFQIVVAEELGRRVLLGPSETGPTIGMGP